MEGRVLVATGVDIGRPHQADDLGVNVVESLLRPNREVVTHAPCAQALAWIVGK